MNNYQIKQLTVIIKIKKTLFCPRYAPGHRHCKDAVQTVEAAKFTWQWRQMSLYDLDNEFNFFLSVECL